MALEKGIYTKGFPFNVRLYKKLSRPYQELIIYLEKYYTRVNIKHEDGYELLRYYRLWEKESPQSDLYLVISCSISYPPWLSAGIFRIFDTKEEDVACCIKDMDRVCDLGDGFTSRFEVEKVIKEFREKYYSQNFEL